MTVTTLINEYIEPALEQEDGTFVETGPTLIEPRVRPDGSGVLFVGSYSGTLHVDLDEFDDVTNDRDALTSELITNGPVLLLDARIGANGTIEPESLYVRIVYNYHYRPREHGNEDLFAEYYAVSVNHINDTQQTAWHLTHTTERDEVRLLYQ